jgi:hypothetical protein
MNQNWDLALRIDTQDFRVFGLVTVIVRKWHHHDVDRQPLLESRDVTLGSEHAKRPGIKRHRLNEARSHDTEGDVAELILNREGVSGASE